MYWVIFLGFNQLIPESYRSYRPNNITGIDETLLKSDCTNGSIVNGIRGAILSLFALGSSPGHKAYKELRRKLFSKIIKYVLAHITFYLGTTIKNRLKSMEKQYFLLLT